jgi:hypothetical protein
MSLRHVLLVRILYLASMSLREITTLSFWAGVEKPLLVDMSDASSACSSSSHTLTSGRVTRDPIS